MEPSWRRCLFEKIQEQSEGRDIEKIATKVCPQDKEKKRSMSILHVVGARPNFMKAAPVYRAVGQTGLNQILVHTGQHYDAKMSDVFFEELNIPEPDVHLNVGSGSHAQQTASVMIGLERVLFERKPEMVVVYGDVNSTVAAAMVCAKIGVKIAHVEAGLRSFDRTMPEEINRLVTDQLSDLLFTPSQDGNDNLQREGIPPEKIHMVGNVMIDTLAEALPRADDRFPAVRARLGVQSYALVTLHRPANVDDERVFVPMLEVLDSISHSIPLVFPVHPRTRQRWSSRLEQCNRNLIVTDPLGYLDFLALQKNALLVMTDSGGIQEETTWLGIPCLTLRQSTERPITVTMGTNVLVGRDWELLRESVSIILKSEWKKGLTPPLWDGAASVRIANILRNWSSGLLKRRVQDE
jgi:UDP-N-acetylglucosamine 2-epimerase (non-hydrolysing)